jgi:tetratricopeptide (TPR) repeat protein
MDAWIVAASIARVQGDWGKARAEIDEALRRRPGASDAYAELAMIDRLSGSGKDVDENVNAALAHDGGNFVPLVTAGDAALDQGSCAQAEEDYFRALKIAPENEEALIALGKLYRIANRLEDAEAALRRAVITDKRSSSARVELGNLRRENPTSTLSSNGTAEAMYASAQSLQPRDAMAWLEAAELARQQSLFDKAETYLSRSRELNQYEPLLFVYEAALKVSRHQAAPPPDQRREGTLIHYASRSALETLAVAGWSIAASQCSDANSLQGLRRSPVAGAAVAASHQNQTN